MLNQYDNPANPAVHYETTGPEIWEDTQGKITHFVAGIGTGGTVSGTARYLKEKNPRIKVIAADPVGSSIKTYKDTNRLVEALPYLVEGVGQERIPGNLELNLVDEVMNISDKDSFVTARRLAREEGIFCGGSSGMNVAAALRVAKLLPREAVVVAIICDTGERYLTKHHSDEWLKEKDLLDVDRMTLKMVIQTKSSERNIPQLVSISASDSVQDALNLMRTYELSELPVIDTEQILGTVRESKLMAEVIDNRATLMSSVDSLMEKPMPMLDAHADLSEAISCLRNYPALLVTEFSRPIGVLSRHDILEYL